jgi:hypothetical protein
MNENPELAEIRFSYVQEGNTDGTTADTEELEIRWESILLGPPGFCTIRTPTGWSINDPDEVYGLLITTLDVVRRLTEVQG